MGTKDVRAAACVDFYTRGDYIPGIWVCGEEEPEGHVGGGRTRGVHGGRSQRVVRRWVRALEG